MYPYTMIASAAVSGLGNYLSNRAAKKAQEDAYNRQMQNLTANQGLETQSMHAGLDYEQGLVNRGIGDTAAATGMTGSAISQRLGDISAARNEAMRKFAFGQMMQKRQTEQAHTEQGIQQAGAQKAAIWRGLGDVASKAIGISTPAAAPPAPTQLLPTPTLSNSFAETIHNSSKGNKYSLWGGQ